MRKIICDRCGAEITGDRIGYVAVNWRATSDDSLMQNNPYECMDFCEECMKDIANVIDFNFKVEVGTTVIDAALETVEDPVEEETETVEGAVEGEPLLQVKKASVKKPVDKGKVGALAAAGWSNVKIANEMNISSERVRQILKELEAQK